MTAAVVLTTGAICAGLVVAALPAYADVTSGYYTIGTVTGAVTTVVASPTTVVNATPTNFEVSFTASAGLAGSSDSFITVAPSEDFASPPSSIDIVGGSCIQSGTSGAGGPGTAIAGGLTVELGSSCTITGGSTVQVYFTADAPPSTGSFYFTVTTSANSTLATSNTVTVNGSAATLTAALYGFGANTTYTITNMPVNNLTANQNSLFLDAQITSGTEALTFYPGVAGYSVTFTPSGGSATADPVETANIVGNSVTLTLADALANGDELDITATGTNPAAIAAVQSNRMEVEPGNGTADLTNSITFGNSVSDVTVSPSTTVAGASASYTVSFKASSSMSAGDINFSETAGPTNFTSVTGVEVSDTTQGWHFVATGVAPADGTISIPSTDAIVGGDYITVVLVNVTNPPAGTISDFHVTTTADGVASTAAPYTIGANASPGVVVSVNPSSTSALATYSISNLRASAALVGGSSTITIEGPAGTVFPNNSSFYDLQDLTTTSGTAAANAVVSGGGSNTVVIRVANSANAGDLLALDIEDVINPSAASTTYSITLLGSVTTLAPTTTTTTTTVPTTTTTRPKPVVTSLTKSAAVVKKTVQLKLGCKLAACSGVITLVDVRTELGHSKYHLAPGKTGTVTVGLFAEAGTLLAGAKHHTIKVTETVTVAGGRTISPKLSLVG
jgi:hypothetical protein